MYIIFIDCTYTHIVQISTYFDIGSDSIFCTYSPVNLRLTYYWRSVRRSQYVPNEISHFYNETDSSEYIESIYSIDKYTYYFMKSPSISRPLFLTPTPAPIGITHATDFVKIVPTKHQLYEIHMLTFKNVLAHFYCIYVVCT